ncbi:hypothetical protein MFKK_09030 [Halopseudomonas aestusnigri]|nr:hypothetical protein MFKK_09030 [Halopseudomonas aestusnigri]
MEKSAALSTKRHLTLRGVGAYAVRRSTTTHTVNHPTSRRTQGATSVTVGNATGQVNAQLLSHAATKCSSKPWVAAITKADTKVTMIADSNAPNTIGAKRAGIAMSDSFNSIEKQR